MFFATKLFAIAALALVPFTSAQGTKIQLTQIPGPAIIGQPSTIKWTGGDNSPVTLILFEGNLPSPKTIGIIASNINGNSFTWTPGTAISPNDDYLLQITQGLEDSNYSGQFTVQNATAAQATTIYAVAGSSTIAISTVLPNATSTVTLQGASTTAASASGTGGISIARNTTFVSQSLTSTGTATVGTATTTATSAGTTTTASTGTSAGGAVARATAQGVLGFGAVAAAAMYLL